MVIPRLVGCLLAVTIVMIGGASPADDKIIEPAIRLEIVSTPRSISHAELLHWINTAARAVTHYYGHFPVKRVVLHISGNGRGDHVHGRTYSGRRINMRLGAEATAADLNDDWVLTHEMFHLAFPDLDASHLWMNEGLSTYLEPIARVRIGTLTPARIWRDMLEGVPKGLPQSGDEGLDRTHTWGRTYWGGCLFWLMADVRIRERTHNQHSLDDALRAILDAGGDGSADWSISRIIATGDAATGTDVLRQLYDEMATKPAAVDLDALWRDLGIRRRGGQITFDEAAPLANIRRSIAQEPSTQTPEPAR